MVGSGGGVKVGNLIDLINLMDYNERTFIANHTAIIRWMQLLISARDTALHYHFIPPDINHCWRCWTQPAKSIAMNLE